MYNKPNMKTKSNLNSQNENFQTFFFFLVGEWKILTQNGPKKIITKQTNKPTQTLTTKGVLESKNKVNHVSTNLQTGVLHNQLPILSISNLWLRRNPQSYDTEFEFIQRVHNHPELQQKCSIRKIFKC